MKSSEWINTLKVGKELGYGMFGTTYLATDKNGKRYAYKITHILKKNIGRLKNNEIKFSKEMGGNHFMKFYAWDIIDNCTHKQRHEFKVDGSFGKYLKELDKSPYCSRLIYSLIDGSIKKLLPKMENDLKLTYSIMVQFCFAVYQMEKKGFLHNDLWSANIAYIKKSGAITCFGRKIPTCGYILVLIDYGNVIHSSNADPRSKKAYKDFFGRETNSIVEILANYDEYFEYVIKKLKLRIHTLAEDLPKFKKTKQFKELGIYTSNLLDKFLLFNIFYPTELQKLQLGKHYERTIPPKIIVPIEDIIFCIRAKWNSKKIGMYFYGKLISL